MTMNANSEKVKVLVTGANGFVGSRICRRLINDGYDVYAGIRRGCDGSLIEELKLKVRFGDITRPDELPEFVSGMDLIVHNAGIVKSKKKSQLFEVNEKGTANLLDAAINSGDPKKFVYVSSLAAMGVSEKGAPLTEDSPPAPLTEYGKSKLAGEEVVREYSNQINTVILRPSGIYGPGDKEMYTFFNTLNNRIKPYIGSLSRRIQLTHVDDFASAVSSALSADVESGSAYFIAEDKSYSYYEMVKILRKAVGRVSLPIYVPGFLLKIIASLSSGFLKMFGVTPMLTPEKTKELLGNWEVSIDKARNDLGYQSIYDFEKGASETVDWYRLEGWL